MIHSWFKCKVNELIKKNKRVVVEVVLQTDVEVVLQTDKAGKLVLETLDDLNNIMLLRKRKRERKTPASKPIPATAPLVGHVA